MFCRCYATPSEAVFCYSGLFLLSTFTLRRRPHILGERLSAWGWVGILVSCGGIALITLSQSSSFHLDFWALLILTSACSACAPWRCLCACRSHSRQYPRTKRDRLVLLSIHLHYAGPIPTLLVAQFVGRTGGLRPP